MLLGTVLFAEMVTMNNLLLLLHLLVQYIRCRRCSRLCFVWLLLHEVQASVCVVTETLVAGYSTQRYPPSSGTKGLEWWVLSANPSSHGSSAQ